MYQEPMVNIIFQPQEQWFLRQREADSSSTAWLQPFSPARQDQPHWQGP